jgi:hypothetical protein
MDLEAPEMTKADARSRRARTLILVLMAVFIVAPVVVWILTAGGAAQKP